MTRATILGAFLLNLVPAVRAWTTTRAWTATDAPWGLNRGVGVRLFAEGFGKPQPYRKPSKKQKEVKAAAPTGSSQFGDALMEGSMDLPRQSAFPDVSPAAREGAQLLHVPAQRTGPHRSQVLARVFFFVNHARRAKLKARQLYDH